MPSKFLLIFLLFSIFMLPTGTVLGQVSEPIVVDTTGTKKIRYLVISGGGTDKFDRTAINGKANDLKALLDKWAQTAGGGSQVDISKDQSEDSIKDRIKSIGNTLKGGEELVIFFFGHGNAETGAWQIREFSEPFGTRGEITGEELRDAISGFEKGVTISIISGSCVAGKLEKDVTEAKDKNGDKYGNTLRYLGSGRLTETSDWNKGLITPFGDFENNNIPDGAGQEKIWSTDKYKEFLHQQLKDFFALGDLPPSQDGTCAIAGLISDGIPVDGIDVGGKIIPIESTSLLLAGVQSTTWLIPVILSAAGIGLVLVRRK